MYLSHLCSTNEFVCPPSPLKNCWFYTFLTISCINVTFLLITFPNPPFKILDFLLFGFSLFLLKSASRETFSDVYRFVTTKSDHYHQHLTTIVARQNIYLRGRSLDFSSVLFKSLIFRYVAEVVTVEGEKCPAFHTQLFDCYECSYE